MKKSLAFFILISVALAFLGCPNPASDSTAVTFSGLTANGTSGSVTTTLLTLTFSADPTTLAASDITVTGATRGALSGSGTSRSLAISAITVADSANVTVALANPAGFTITPASLNTAVFVGAAPSAVTFSGLTANGTSGVVTTTSLTLTFSADPTTLAASDITVTGATKGALSGTGTNRSLAISAITVANGANVTVTVSSPAGFTITPPSKTVAVSIALSSAKAITAFSLVGIGTGSIDETNHRIFFAPASGTSLAGRIATFTTTGTSVHIGLTTQISGTTSNNFTATLTYTVTAQDASTQDYTVVSLLPATSLGTMVQSASQISLGWIDNSSQESGWAIDRKPVGGAWTTIASGLAANTTSYIDTIGLSAGSYNYVVYATHAAGHSQYSNAAIATIPTPPTAPSNLAMGVPVLYNSSGTYSFDLNFTWSDNSSNEDWFYFLGSKDNLTWSNESYQRAAGTTSLSNVHAIIFPGDTGYEYFAENTTYYFKVRAENVGGIGDSSPMSWTTTYYPVAAIGHNSDLWNSSTSRYDIPVIDWVEASAAATNYKIYRSYTSPTSGYTLLGTVAANSGGANQGTFTDSGCSAALGATLYYKVVATNASGTIVSIDTVLTTTRE